MIRGPHREELVAFFTGAESASGLVSSWSALVGIALGGTGGSRDPEARITDRRFHLGPAGRTAISRVREVRAALVQLSDRQQKVLFAAHGPVAWSKYLDAVFGKGMGAKVTGKLGDLIGVALLTDAVVRGFREENAPAEVSDGLNAWEHVGTQRNGEPLYRCRGAATPVRSVQPAKPRGAEKPGALRAASWNTEGGWLVNVCLRGARRPRFSVRLPRWLTAPRTHRMPKPRTSRGAPRWTKAPRRRRRTGPWIRPSLPPEDPRWARR
jgi:hypothetical protein